MPERLARRPADPRCLARRAPVPCKARTLPYIYMVYCLCVSGVYTLICWTQLLVATSLRCRMISRASPRSCGLLECMDSLAPPLLIARLRAPLPLAHLRPSPRDARHRAPPDGGLLYPQGRCQRSLDALRRIAFEAAHHRRPGRLTSRRRAGIHWAPRDEIRPPAPGGSQCGALI